MNISHASVYLIAKGVPKIISINELQNFKPTSESDFDVKKEYVYYTDDKDFEFVYVLRLGTSENDLKKQNEEKRLRLPNIRNISFSLKNTQEARESQNENLIVSSNTSSSSESDSESTILSDSDIFIPKQHDGKKKITGKAASEQTKKKRKLGRKTNKNEDDFGDDDSDFEVQERKKDTTSRPQRKRKLPAQSNQSAKKLLRKINAEENENKTADNIKAFIEDGNLNLDAIEKGTNFQEQSVQLKSCMTQSKSFNPEEEGTNFQKQSVQIKHCATQTICTGDFTQEIEREEYENQINILRIENKNLRKLISSLPLIINDKMMEIDKAQLITCKTQSKELYKEISVVNVEDNLKAENLKNMSILLKGINTLSPEHLLEEHDLNDSGRSTFILGESHEFSFEEHNDTVDFDGNNLLLGSEQTETGGEKHERNNREPSDREREEIREERERKQEQGVQREREQEKKQREREEREIERDGEIERVDLERQRERQREIERADLERQREIERVELEHEREEQEIERVDLERQRERQREIERADLERQREIERVELEHEREEQEIERVDLERQRERQREIERADLERQREIERVELEHQREEQEIERVDLERQRERQREIERADLERQREIERVELEHQREEQEIERVDLERQRERQREIERADLERQREIERVELEHQREEREIRADEDREESLEPNYNDENMQPPPPAAARSEYVRILGKLYSRFSLENCSRLSVGRYVGDLATVFFTKNELKTSSITGKQSNAYRHRPPSKQLDPEKVKVMEKLTYKIFGDKADTRQLFKSTLRAKCSNSKERTRREPLQPQ